MLILEGSSDNDAIVAYDHSQWLDGLLVYVIKGGRQSKRPRIGRSSHSVGVIVVISALVLPLGPGLRGNTRVGRFGTWWSVFLRPLFGCVRLDGERMDFTAFDVVVK